MPYIQRDSDGKITGVFANKQPGYAEEFLPEDNAEVIAFRERMDAVLGPPPTPMTIEEARRLEAQHKELEKEHQKLRSAVLALFQAWAELELALSALLYEILGIEPRSSHIAYAIYYSPTSIEARAELIHNALSQLIAENKGLASIAPLWGSIYKKISRARAVRNAVAHGTLHTLNIRGKNYARLTSPAFDVIRVGRIISKGQIPGIPAHDLMDAVKRVKHLMECVDDVNRAIVAFREGPSAFQAKLLALQDRLQSAGSQSLAKD